MSNSVLKYENFFSEKVYYCPCWENAINEIFKKQIRSYTEIMLAVLNVVLVMLEFFAQE